MKKPELLAPAGNMEKLKYALHYGADAVYMAGQRFGLRAKAGNFTPEEMIKAVNYVHKQGKKVYVTLNIIPHNHDFVGLAKYVSSLEEMGVNGVIVADPGILKVVRENAPNLQVSLSTQANNTNYYSANFWHDMGVRRIVAARELGIDEIKEIVENTPETLQIETFIHGSMCISYSGRCLLSNYFTARDANKGDCAQPCRWNYSLMEETRPGVYYPVYEDAKGTYIFNSKDLCLIEELPQLINAGVSSFKIEGRMKSIFYLSTVVSMYRKAIDSYFQDPHNYQFQTQWLDELKKVSHREYTKGFAYQKPGYTEQNYDTSSYIRGYDFVGVVLNYDKKSGIATIEQRNKITIGDTIEIMKPVGSFITYKVTKMWNEQDEPIETIPHPKAIFKMRLDIPVEPLDILRKEN